MKSKQERSLKCSVNNKKNTDWSKFKRPNKFFFVCSDFIYVRVITGIQDVSNKNFIFLLQLIKILTHNRDIIVKITLGHYKLIGELKLLCNNCQTMEFKWNMYWKKTENSRRKRKIVWDQLWSAGIKSALQLERKTLINPTYFSVLCFNWDTRANFNCCLFCTTWVFEWKNKLIKTRNYWEFQTYRLVQR